MTEEWIQRTVVLSSEIIQNLMSPKNFGTQEFHRCVKGLPENAKFKELKFDTTHYDLKLVFESTEWDKKQEDKPVDIEFETVKFSEEVLGGLK